MKKHYDKWRRTRERYPWHVALDIFVDGSFSDGWWRSSHPEYRPWKGRIYNVVAGSAEWIRKHWPLCIHYVIDDHCMKPEHRFCLYCNKKMPNHAISGI